MMSGWQELRAERNRRSLDRLNKVLPAAFPRAVLARAHERPFVPPTPRLAIESYWRAHPIRADRLARALAARSQAPAGWVGGSEIERAAYLSPSAHHPHRSVNKRTPWAQDFAACAVNRSTASAGTLTFGLPVPTRTPSGTAPVWSRGSSGMRRVATSNCCGVSKVAGALKAACGYGAMPKLTIASRCSGSGANTDTRLGRDCSIFGGCQTFR
jgi:hypothetical protein